MRLDIGMRHEEDHINIFAGPRIIAAGFPVGEFRLDYLGQAGLAFYVPRRRLTFQGYVTAQAGKASSRVLLIQPTWNGTGLPPEPQALNTQPGNDNRAQFDTELALVQVGSEASAEYKFTERTAGRLGGGFTAFGGLDPESIAQLPLSYGPSVFVGLDRDVSRRDKLDTRVTGEYRILQFPGQDVPPIKTLSGEESWKHKFSPLANMQLGGVGTAVDQGARGARLFLGAEGNTTFGFRQRRARAQLIFVAKYGAHNIHITGEVVRAVEGQAAAAWTVGRTTYRIQSTVIHTFETVGAQSTFDLFGGELALLHKLSRVTALDTGVRAGYQRLATEQNGPPQVIAPLQVMLFLAFSYTSVPIKL